MAGPVSLSNLCVVSATHPSWLLTAPCSPEKCLPAGGSSAWTSAVYMGVCCWDQLYQHQPGNNSPYSQSILQDSWVSATCISAAIPFFPPVPSKDCRVLTCQLARRQRKMAVPACILQPSPGYLGDCVVNSPPPKHKGTSQNQKAFPKAFPHLNMFVCRGTDWRSLGQRSGQIGAGWSSFCEASYRDRTSSPSPNY